MAERALIYRPSALRLTPMFWVAVPALVMALAFFYPASSILTQALTDSAGAWSLSGFTEVLSSGLFHRALFNSLFLSLSSTLGCLVLGFVLSMCLAFLPFRGASAVSRFIDIFIALPTFLVILSFTFLYGSSGLLNAGLQQVFHLALPPVNFLYSRWGVVLAEITVYTPFVIRPLMACFESIEPAQLEMASVLGASPWHTIRKIIFPAAVPALMTGGSLCLLLTINEFGIVLFVGAKDVQTLPMLIYNQAIQQFNYPVACVIAIINIVISLVLLGAYRGFSRRWGG